MNLVFKLDTSGVLTRVAGNSRAGYSGDGGPAINAQLQLGLGLAAYVPAGVTVDRAGNLFIADTGNHRIRRVAGNGTITTVAGNGEPGFSGDGGAAASAQLYYPTGVAVDGAGNLFIADLSNNRVRRVSAAGIITTAAGSGGKGFSGDGGAASSAELNQPRGVAVDSAGNLFIADSFNFSIRKVALDGTIATVASSGKRGISADGGPATLLDFPTRVAVDGAGNLFIADGGRVRMVTADGTITTAAGDGTCCSSGDGGSASTAQVAPVDVAVDRAGNLFIAVKGAIRKVSAGGIIATVAGNSTGGYASDPRPVSDGGPAVDSALRNPRGVAVDGWGNLFIADSGNHRVRVVSPDGIIGTVAGNGACCYSGDGGPATSAALGERTGVAVDGAGNLFIADPISRTIRKVSPDGIITTVAGGADGALTSPAGVAVDAGGSLFIADFGGKVVRKVTAGGTITTVAGNGTDAELRGPTAVTVDAGGNLFIADYGVVWKAPASGIMTIVAGGGTLRGDSAEGAPATSVYLAYPGGVAVDAAGNLFIADGSPSFFEGDDVGFDNNRVAQVAESGNVRTVAGNGIMAIRAMAGPPSTRC